VLAGAVRLRVISELKVVHWPYGIEHANVGRSSVEISDELVIDRTLNALKLGTLQNARNNVRKTCEKGTLKRNNESSYQLTFMTRVDTEGAPSWPGSPDSVVKSWTYSRNWRAYSTRGVAVRSLTPSVTTVSIAAKYSSSGGSNTVSTEAEQERRKYRPLF
jgi:hypothetical protein